MNFFKGSSIRVHAWLAWGLCAAWGLLVFTPYLSRFAPDMPALLDMFSVHKYVSGSWPAAAAANALNVLTGLFFMFACAGTGRFLLALFKAPAMNVCEEITFSTALGLAVVAQAVLGLAAAGLLYREPIVVLLLVSLGLGIWSVARNPRAPEPWPIFKPNLGDIAALALLAAALLLGLAGALSPEIYYDSLVYHLAVPNFYTIRHGLADMPHNLYSNHFLLHGMLYAAGLLLKDEFVPKFINYAAIVFGALAVLGLGARHFSVRAGLLAALIFCTVTHTQIATWATGTEALLTFFSLTALAAILRYQPGATLWLLLGAALAGAALAVKATGLFAAAGIALVLCYRLRGHPGAVRRALPGFCLTALIPVLPWLAKNLVYRHNPFFPFLVSVFGVPANVDPLKVRAFIDEARQMGALEFKTWLVHPWTITMGEAVHSQFFSPLFLFLLPLLFLFGPAAPVAQACRLYILTVWLLWSTSSTMVRFLMPAYPVAALVIAAALEGRSLAALKRTLSAIVLLGAALGLYWAGWLYHAQGLWRPLTGVTTKRAYLSRTQPAYAYSHFSAIEFINDKLPPKAKTLIVGDSRSFYLRKDFIVSSVFDKNPIVEWTKASKNGEELYARLKHEGVSHLLLNSAEAIRLGRGYRLFDWDAPTRAVFNAFWNRHVKEVFTADEEHDGRLLNRVIVYELVPAPAPGDSPPVNVMEDVVMKKIDRG